MFPNDTNLPYTHKSNKGFRLGGRQIGNDEYGTLIFDQTGRICGSGAAADNLFGAAMGRITGKEISEFIPGIQVGDSARAHKASTLASLCEWGEWQPFEAMDVLGRGFVTEILLSLRMMNGQDVYVLNFYRPGVPLFSRIA